MNFPGQKVARDSDHLNGRTSSPGADNEPKGGEGQQASGKRRTSPAGKHRKNRPAPVN
jgi:hypothetical protein